MKLKTPISIKDAKRLKVGDIVLLSGVIYTARDQAHKRLVESVKRYDANLFKMPFPLEGQVIYYTGPTPTPTGFTIGSCGPTTSSRMDSFTIPLLEKGLKATIGKGPRSRDVVEAMKKYSACYLVVSGGCGALISNCVKKCDIIAYPDLGPEAVYKLEVENMSCVVACDSYGNDIFELGNKTDER